MLLRILPVLLVVVPVIGFFYTPEPPSSISNSGSTAIAALAYSLFTIPWWGKLLSIVVGVLWISSWDSNKDAKE